MAHQTPDFYEPTSKLIVSANTVVNIGDYVSGYGIQPGTKVIKISGYGNNQLSVILNKKPWTGNTPPSALTQSGAIGDEWHLMVTFNNFKTDGIYTESKNVTVSFKEDVKGWVSFKSFTPENAISVANEYYTFFNGKLFKHHIENIDRNTFYKGEVFAPFIPSSINVILNDVLGTVKSFSTLNYEGSQSKVDKFTTDITTGLTDGEYYNLKNKKGWYVESIETDKEKGSLNEFIEKEGKWFNYLKGQSVKTTNKNNLIINKDGSSSFDQASFAIQGIGTAVSGTINCVYGCTDESNYYYNPLANCDDGSCAPTPSWDCIDGSCIDPGDGGGYYKSLSACQNLCRSVLESWDCTQKDPSLPGTCIDPGTGNGEFGSLSACQNSCGGYNSWNCGVGQTGCIDGGINGLYQTLAECEATPCPSLTWDCVSIGNPGNTTNTCMPANTPGNGQYASLTACQTDCATPITASWDCDGQGNCTDPGDGSGQYTILGNCLNACCIPCTNKISQNMPGDGTALGDATNASCDNGTYAAQHTSTDGTPWTLQVFETTTSGQYFGGTLFYEQTNIPSGTMSTPVILPQGNYHTIRMDNTGCPISGCFGTGNAFYIDCTYTPTSS